MRKKLVAGNWKMHGSQATARSLAVAIAARASEFPGVEIGVCPPFVMLPAVATVLAGSEIGFGAQTVSEYAEGAYTGEVSAAMLVELGCRYVLVGHSERRQLFAESSHQITAKLAQARAAGLRPVLCVGETLAERQSAATARVIAAQLAPLCARTDAAELLLGSVLAYEPVWAIGTGETCEAAEANRVIGIIRDQLTNPDVTIQYGGSVKPSNINEIMAQPHIDGVLVGGASLAAADFAGIVNYQ